MRSNVTEVPAAHSTDALIHFSRMLTFETDCWDVNDAVANGKQDFVLLDVRSPEMFARGHVPGALNLPRGKITDRKLAEWPQATTFVVYCAGPHCNGANKAAVRLAELNRPVKMMIGGVTGWIDEGFALETTPAAEIEAAE